ncbi:MAG: O-antigen ligase family protein, partial [bacterium]|nr:O-antigen ligase family protein [bacterium]
MWITLIPALGWVSNNAIPGLFQCSLWCMAYFIFCLSSSPSRLWTIFIKTMWLLGLISALYALIQFFILDVMPGGFFASKNSGAAFLMVTTLLLIGEFAAIPSQQNHQKLNSLQTTNATNYSIFAHGFSIYIITFAMSLSLSRGVLLVFVFFVLVELLLIRKYIPKPRLFLLLFLILIAFLSIVFCAQAAIEHRLDILQHEKSRFIIWEGAWHLWQQTPWYGIGIFNFSRYYPTFSLPGDGSTLQYAHNDYLQ